MNSRYENHIPIVNPTKISIPISVPIGVASLPSMVTGIGSYAGLLWSAKVSTGRRGVYDRLEYNSVPLDPGHIRNW
jgi:hypothetical protein